jgi:hypothetical protein
MDSNNQCFTRVKPVKFLDLIDDIQNGGQDKDLTDPLPEGEFVNA